MRKDQGNAKLEDSNLVGTASEIVEKAVELREAGVTQFLGLYFAANSIKDLLEQMEVFAREIMPALVT